MRIEAVIVCKDYSDFLAHTLPNNQQHLDRIVVVTHPDDRATQRLCAQYGVDCVATTEMHRDGAAFNKGRAINVGIMHLGHTDWLLHLDADTYLPHRFREMLHHAQLDKANIYGCDRLNTKSFDNWEEHKHKTVPQHQWRFMVTPHAEFPLGARLMHQELGYCPIGYFQLWHSSLKRTYPIHCGSAEHSDVVFAAQWPRPNRVLLPEMFVYHLESDGAAPMGINWKGRKTPPFGPKHCSHGHRRGHCHHHHCHHHHGHHHHYCKPK